MLLKQRVHIAKKCTEISKIAEIIDKKILENIQKKLTITNIRKLCFELKKQNKILSTNQICPGINPAKRQKQNTSPFVETNNDTKLRKISKKSLEQKHTVPKIVNQNSNYIQKTSIKVNIITNLNSPERLGDKTCNMHITSEPHAPSASSFS